MHPEVSLSAACQTHKIIPIVLVRLWFEEANGQIQALESSVMLVSISSSLYQHDLHSGQKVAIKLIIGYHDERILEITTRVS